MRGCGTEQGQPVGQEEGRRQREAEGVQGQETEAEERRQEARSAEGQVQQGLPYIGTMPLHRAT